MKETDVKKITFSIGPKTLARLDELADGAGNTRSGFIRWLVDQEYQDVQRKKAQAALAVSRATGGDWSQGGE